MPFDALPAEVVSDVAILRVALDGVRRRWTAGSFGLTPDDSHCAIGWLLVATDYNYDETTRLALKYVYPALPERTRQRADNRISAIWGFNDNHDKNAVVGLFSRAIELASH